MKIFNAKYFQRACAIAFGFVLFSAVQLSAQDLIGPDEVEVNVEYNYTISPSCSCTVNWSTFGSTAVITNATNNGATLKFTVVGWETIQAGFTPGLGLLMDVLVFSSTPPGTTTLTTNEEYFVKKPGLTTAASVYSQTSPADVLKSTVYSDGLGRAHQQVVQKGTVDQKDFVGTTAYDAYGRVTQQYLPWESTDSNGSYKTAFETQRNNFYTSQYGAGVTHEYSESQYEASPLNRPTKDMAPGNNWVGSNRGISYSYRFNTSSEEVGVWDGTSRTGTFASNKLYVTEITDEHGNKTLDYTDPYGRTILKKVQEATSPSVHHDGWLCTYYVYDDLFRLTAVIPPKAVQKIKANSWVVSATVSDELLFHYTYDNLGRIISKEVPGAEPEEYVYDKADRPVLMRTSVQATQSQWSFVMYDSQGRQAMSGTYAGSTSRSTLQSTVDGAAFNYFETHRVNPGGYTASNDYYYKPMVGLSSFTPEQVMYYDDYSFTSTLTKTFSTAYNTAMSGGTYAETPASSDFTLGMLTGSKTKQLGTANWQETVHFYDKKSRLIQVRAKNHKGGEDIVTNKYDFSGKMLFSYTHHKNPSAVDFTEVKSMTRYTYDHADRLTKLEMRQDYPSVGSWQTVGEYVYDALGQLIDKKLGNNTQNIDYAYNVRGWLKQINNPASIGSDYFGMELYYDDASVTGRKNYNGNIGEISWKSAGDSDQKRYEFTYDKVNRLTTAYYNNLNDNTRDNDYTVNNITYDANGNIKTLRRYGEVMGTETEIDNLVYTYSDSDNSNRLQKVADDPSQAFSIGDFKDGYTGTTDYTYDSNGNMLRDLNKGMVADIVYNRFNLPETVNFGSGKTITYKYTGAGVKIQKIINDNGDSRTFDYIGAFVYEDNALQQFAHPEGRVRNSNNTLVYDYIITDHLGNSRITFTTETSPTLVYKATMETDTHATQGYNIEAYEENYFYNLDASRYAAATANYSTTLDDGCSTCNEGALTNSTQRTGPAIILDVMPGDVLDLEVYAKATGTGTNTAAASSTLITAIVNAFVPTGAASELGLKTNTLLTGLSASQVLGGTPYSNLPRAYLNYIVFDQHFTVVSSGHSRVTSTAFHKLSFSGLSIAQKGYIYVWVSNENSTNIPVYFDDLKISHTKSNILQEDHYYPFGMNMHGLSSSASLAKPNAYKFNGGTELTADFGWQMYDTPFRSYDAQLGRFHQVDPLADKYANYTPYNFAFNDPIYWSDPSGLDPDLEEILRSLWDSPYGGYWSEETGGIEYKSDEQAFWFGLWYMQENDLWGLGDDWNKDSSGGGGDRVIKAVERYYKQQGKGLSWDYNSFKAAGAISLVLVGDDITVVGTIDDVAIPFIYVGATAVFLYDNRELLAKKAKELDRILARATGPPGFTYMLTARKGGKVMNVRGNIVNLKPGDIWKIGETTQGFSRYSAKELKTMIPGGVNMVPVHYGSQLEIKIKEKELIYGYFFKNGKLPPGNKIFR